MNPFAEVDSDEAGSEQNQVFVAICYSQNVLGAACYDELKNEIIADSFELSTDGTERTLSFIKSIVHPTLFLLHPNIISNHSLLQLILTDIEGDPNRYAYKAVKSSSWNEKFSHHVIFNSLKLRENSTDGIDTYRKLASSISIDKIQVRQSLGALVAYVQESVFNLDEGKVIVNSITPFPLNSFLRMDSNSFKALQIFKEDMHPNWIKGKGRSKEGFSLFGLFDRTSSIVGRKKLREWMLTPFNDMPKILERQRGVSFAADDTNREMLSVVGQYLRHVYDIPRLLLRIKKVEANYSDWCKLYHSLMAGLSILDCLVDYTNSKHTSKENIQYIHDFFGAIDGSSLRLLCHKMSNVIDFPQSEKNREIVINEGFDMVLDQKRDIYNNLEGYLVEAAQKLLDQYLILNRVSVEYVPQLGYLVAMEEEAVVALIQYQLMIGNRSKKSSTNSDGNESLSLDTPADESEPQEDDLQELLDKGHFQFMFAQDNISYFKHSLVLEMDRTFGDIKNDIYDRQRCLTISLEEKLLEMEMVLLQLTELLSTFDVYSSLGKITTQYQLIKPQIVEDPVLILKNGRHLLQELTVDNFVPNDTFLSAERNIALITGPNSSGKSIYLKQVGLIVYLAHIGCFVPCERAIIGLTDQIVTRIASEETVATPQSTFTIDLCQMSKILKYATRQTLCLVDEFGKGTTPTDGMALLAAVIQHFAMPPEHHQSRSIFVLHFTEILQSNILSTSMMERITGAQQIASRNLRDQLIPSIHCFRMETLKEVTLSVDDNGDADLICCDKIPTTTDTGQLIPLYKLKYGIEEDSEGIHCAQIMGIPQAVISRAFDIKSHIQLKTPIRRHQMMMLPSVSTSVSSRVSSTSSMDLLTSHRPIIELFLKHKNWMQSSVSPGSRDSDHFPILKEMIFTTQK